jgi:type 1 glutamine amidotransferase/sugar phosphate isomerase/epimerase
MTTPERSLPVILFTRFLYCPKWLRRALWLLALTAFLPAGCVQAQVFVSGDNAAAFFEGVPDYLQTTIRNALPKEAVAVPQKPRKLLVITANFRDGAAVKGHPSIPYANYALYRMGEQTGAYQAFFSNDTAAFQPEVLRQFDAVCLNNTVGVLFNDPATRQALLDYVFEGHGIMGIHGGAGATFVQYPVYDQFPEFGEMMGGYENGGHPWKTHEWINLVVSEPGHPLGSGFDRSDFDVSDEIYQYTHPYSRDHLRVVLEVNTQKTDMNPARRFLPERQLDRDFPVSWIKTYGRGRVFNTALGHHPHISWDGRLQQHFLRGLQYVLGDLEAPATPNNKLDAAALAREKLGWRLGIAAWTFRDKTFFETVDESAALGVWYVGGLNVQKVGGGIDKNFDPELSDAELLQVRRKLLDKGVTLVEYFIHDIPADEAFCRRLFEFARKMGIETIIGEPKPEALDLIERFCVEYNIRLAIHNHGPNLSPVYWKPEGVLEVIKGRSPLIGACGDLGYWMRNGVDPATAVRLLGQRLLAVQVHDLHERSASGHDVPWGQGQSQLGEFFRLVRDLELNPSLIGLEYSYNWGQSLPEIRESIRFFDAAAVRLAAAP